VQTARDQANADFPLHSGQAVPEIGRLSRRSPTAVHAGIERRGTRPHRRGRPAELVYERGSTSVSSSEAIEVLRRRERRDGPRSVGPEMSGLAPLLGGKQT